MAKIEVHYKYGKFGLDSLEMFRKSCHNTELHLNVFHIYPETDPY